MERSTLEDDMDERLEKLADKATDWLLEMEDKMMRNDWLLELLAISCLMWLVSY